MSRSAWDLTKALTKLPPKVRNDLKGTQLVETPEMKLLGHYARGAVLRGEMIGVDGPGGTGKTTLLELLAAVSPVRTYLITFPDSTYGKKMWQKIADAVVGPGAKGTETELQNQVLDMLSTEPSLLIIDEATNLKTDVLLALRWLDGLRNKCGIVLAGNDLEKHAEGSGALATRITRMLYLDPMPDEEVLDYVRALHPIFAAASEDLLGYINEARAHGNRRRWVNFFTALNDKHVSVLTPDAADDALGRRPRAAKHPRSRAS